MSDDEDQYSHPEKKIEGRASQKESGENPEFMKRQEQKRSDLDEQLKEYIAEWRKQRSKEEDELKRLKEKQAKRKITRADEEKRLAQKKKEEEERRQREIEEKKQRDIEEKRRRLEESEKKRQAMMQAMKDQTKKGPNFTITKKDLGGNLSSAQIERNKTTAQLEEEKKISLSFRIKPLEIDGLNIDKLRYKATELWDTIVKLETEKYDLEERQKRQDYDLKELKERQKQQLRHKALKKGLDPEALTGKYPPKIQVASKYERRVDTRSYDDKKKLFEGGLTDLIKENHEKNWAEQKQQFQGRQKGRYASARTRRASSPVLGDFRHGRVSLFG
ncbi:troponin T, skeletal muscle isoform X5 [Neodiprion fabricii]|uniref:troponin T, skeletal muscle isoform X5 n=1 Tax=Neodiprion fabricii TaxID=2872261 RepID=UPI001ED96E26|nr:troponin T, skeletal muscle isoform X5 [Neodiprion fabricii]